MIVSVWYYSVLHISNFRTNVIYH